MILFVTIAILIALSAMQTLLAFYRVSAMVNEGHDDGRLAQERMRLAWSFCVQCLVLGVAIVGACFIP